MPLHRVVLTGIGLVTPLGTGTATTWKQVLAGRSATAPIRSFDASPYPVRIAAEVPDFDPRACLAPKVIRRTGRATHLAVAAAAAALEEAGWIASPHGRSDAAVILGSGYGSIPNVEEAYRVFFTRDWTRNPFLSVAMCMPSAPASQVALEFKLSGPCFTVSVACASGAAAIANAALLVGSGAVRRALAGGVDAAVLPGVLSIWCRLGVLSERNDDPAGSCAPFSADRQGLVIGEGACALTLERREDAEARGAPVYAEILASGQTCAADTITAPTLEGEVAAMRLALEGAGLAPEQVGYVNAHGTATRLNDAVETRALHAVFGEHARRVAVSSTKSMIGHTMGAAGAIECAVTALALRDQVLPPTINLRVPDPECDLDYVAGGSRPAAFSAALSNSFAFGGSNAILALGRYVG